MSARVRVVFYAPTFDALGGGETWVNRIANALAGNGHEVHVLGKTRPSTMVAHEWSPSITRRYLDDGERADRGVTMPAKFGSPARRRVRAMARGVADRVLRGWRPPGAFVRDLSPEGHERLQSIIAGLDGQDSSSPLIVICTDVYTGSHLALARRRGRLRVPYVVMHHNSYASLNRGTLRAYREAAQEAEALVALTDEDASGFCAAGVRSVITMPNPGPASDRPVAGADRERTVVWLARMTAVKAGTVAIESWARIASDVPVWRLKMYGEGPDRPNLAALIQRRGLEESVLLCGVTEDPQSVFATAEVNLLTSSFEGWGLVIGEAATQEVPTVSADNSPGVRAQIEHGVSGLLVPIGDVPATAAALRTLMADPVQRREMGRSARETARQFDIGVVVRLWEQYLGSVSS